MARLLGGAGKRSPFVAPRAARPERSSSKRLALRSMWYTDRAQTRRQNPQRLAAPALRLLAAASTSLAWIPPRLETGVRKLIRRTLGTARTERAGRSAKVTRESDSSAGLTCLLSAERGGPLVPNMHGGGELRWSALPFQGFAGSELQCVFIEGGALLSSALIAGLTLSLSACDVSQSARSYSRRIPKIPTSSCGRAG